MKALLDLLLVFSNRGLVFRNDHCTVVGAVVRKDMPDTVGGITMVRKRGLRSLSLSFSCYISPELRKSDELYGLLGSTKDTAGSSTEISNNRNKSRCHLNVAHIPHPTIIFYLYK